MKKPLGSPLGPVAGRPALLLAVALVAFAASFLAPGSRSAVGVPCESPSLVKAAATTQAAGDIPRYGVDYSMTNVDWPTFFRALKASGRDFIGRYLPWKGAAWRQVTSSELKAAAAAGVDYFFWFEDSSNHYRARDGGFATGAADAQEALHSLASLGLPTTTPVYYTVDFPCPDGSQIDAYFRGINSVVPVSQIGVYGNYTTIDWLYQHGLATYFCESNAWPEPQGWHPQAQMHQYVGKYSIGGVSVDRLTVTAADFGQCRRHEEFDPRFYYSGSWTTSSTPVGAASGEGYKYSAAAGASVTVAFSGTSLEWIATKSSDGGSARITLDGTDAGTISLYSATPRYQQKAWSSGLLSNGPHILTIRRSTGRLNVDAFDIAGCLVQYTHAEETGSAFVYAGTWTPSGGTYASGGSFRYANAARASVTIPFTGTYLAWIAKTSPSYGYAKVTVDGTASYNVNLWSAATLYRQSVWNTGTLASGLHWVKIEWTGRPGHAGGGTNVNIDAVDVKGTVQGPTRFEQTDSHLVWAPSASAWTLGTGSTTLYSGGTYRYINKAGSVTVTFTGIRLTLVAKQGTAYGYAKVTVDGTTTFNVKLYNSTTLYRNKVWSTPFLTPANHTVIIAWTGTKAVSTGGTTIDLDAVDVIGVLK